MVKERAALTRLWNTLEAAVLMFLPLVLVTSNFLFPRAAFAQFIGPPSGSPGSTAGAIGVNAAHNISVGTYTPSATSKLLIVASSSADTSNYSLQILYPNQQPVLIVRNDGSIGIGTSSPAYALDVVGSIRSSGSIYGTFSGTVVAANVTGGVFSTCAGCTQSNFALPLSLGVGTSSQVGLPQTLSVYGGGYFSGRVGIGVNNTNSAFVLDARGSLRLGSYNGTGDLYIGPSAYAGSVQGTRIGGWASDDTTFNTTLYVSGNAGGAGANDVGIGTTQPSSTLHVVGGYSILNGLRISGADTTNSIWQVNGALSITTNGTNLNLGYGNGVYALTILGTNGNVGIGTTTPAYTLTVAGNIYATGNVSCGGSCGGGGLSGGAANYVPLWTGATSQGTSSIQQAGANATPYVPANGFAVGTSTSQSTGNIFITGTYLGGTLGAANVTGGVFSTCPNCTQSNFAFPLSLGVGTSSQVGLPNTLSVYGTGMFTGNVRIGVPAGQGTSTIFLGDASTSKQSNYGPEAITFVEPGANRRVFLFTGQSQDVSARFLMDNQGFLEWGPGGSGDQDSSLSRSQATGKMQILNPYGFVVGTPGLTATLFEVNNVTTTATFVATINKPPGSGSATLDIKSVTSTYPVIRAEALNVNDTVFHSFATGDALSRFTIQSDGSQKFGNGSGVADVLTYRPSTSTFAITGVASTSNISVGIGTTMPAYTLAVQGNIYASGNVTCGGTCGGGGLSGGQANYVPIWTSATAQGTSTIYQSGGNVGIGTSTPAQQLHIYNSSANNAGIRLTGSGQTVYYLDLASGNNEHWIWGYGSFPMVFGTNATERMRIDSSGNVGIGTSTPATALQVFGDVRVGNSGTNGCVQNYGGGVIAGTACVSDIRLKKDITPLSGILDKLTELRPSWYYWDASVYPSYHFGSARQLGLVAQDVQKVFPELVSTNSEGYEEVNYSALPLYTLEAVKELKQQNDALRAQNASLEARVRVLEQRLGINL